MERSFSSLKYNGTIPDAIAESQRQKKLLIVYVSGEDEASSRLERDVWPNSQVVDIVSKFCVLLHIRDGTSDATNFSAIYPQKSVPSITVVSYNGAQLWQTDGFINADSLAANLEKSWLSLNIQAATATYITGALYSKSHDASPENNSTTASSSSSSSNLNNTKPQMAESCEIKEETKEESEAIEEHARKQSGITLSIRLPDRSTLLEKFTSDDTLGNVKNLVDSKADNLGNYYLAVPYPRRVFLDEDLNKSLSQLKLMDRQALITVPKGDAPSENTKHISSNDGYFSYLRRFLSFINPLTYLLPRPTTTNQRENETETNTSAAFTRTGSNVHTLKNEDKQNDGRNQYWNGNSTQYGGHDSN